MNLTRPLYEVNVKDINLVGGKAASLGEMIQAGIQIPPGFVVTTDVFRSGMSKDLEQQVLKAFDELAVQRVAVRSSAVAEDSSNASWAGQLETYLNVSREGVFDAIQKCWASINSDHAKSYADENKVSQDQRAVAVVVQAMVDSEVAGVMFTANPVSNDREQVMIEAVYGLGELLVQGSVTPESLVLNKTTGATVDRSSNRQQKKLVYKGGKNQEVPILKTHQPILNDKQIHELLLVANRIEQHYKSPQDIEWAISDSKLYIVQSRPITTLKDATRSSNLTFEKTFTREESLIVVEILYDEFEKWLSVSSQGSIPPMFFRIQKGLLESWFCQEATELLIKGVHTQNIKNAEYLAKNISIYKDLVRKLRKFEQRGYAQNLEELKQYLSVFRKAIIPLHIIFFTPLREDTPKMLCELAVKVRGEDALFDNSDMYVRDSLASLYPDCNGFEAYIGLKDLERPHPAELSKRENNFFWAEGKYLSIDMAEFKQTHPYYFIKMDEIDPNQESITGTTAYKGIVEGKVQIIARKKDIPKFKKGNILVVPMTTPHYLPAMKKAAAFITDEGGVTCHAAIVARELQKPCIIGTKIATQVLKDGDIVKVYATNGIVKIISRKGGDELRMIPSPPKGVKYALTVPQSVLFTELSLQGNKRHYFQEAMSMDYEPEYILVDAGGAMSWNYEHDEAFNKALVGTGSVAEGIRTFIENMSSTARKLSRRSSLGAQLTRRKNNTADILEDLHEYWHAYKLHMTSLFTFWNVEHLLSQELASELKKAGLSLAEGLNRFIVPSETNQYVRERACFEKIVQRFAGTDKTLTAKTAPPELVNALRHHAREFGFLLAPFNLGTPPPPESFLERVQETQQNLMRTNTKQKTNSYDDLPDSLQELGVLAEKLTYWKNERLDIFSMADASVEELYQAAAELLAISTEELFAMTSEEIAGSISKGELILDKKTLATRQAAFCLLFRDGEINFYQPTVSEAKPKDNTLSLSPPPKPPIGVKYALTVPRPVLFFDLSIQSNRRTVMQEAYGVDYERDYAAIDSQAISFNYDSDKAFEAAFTAGRTVEEAISSFIDSMATNARRLERRSSLAAPSTRRAQNKDDILEDLQEYWQACRLHMASLLTFWNIESLLVRTVSQELRKAGRGSMVKNINQYIKSNETNQYMRERLCFEKIVRRFGSGYKDIAANPPSELLSALQHHAREFRHVLEPFSPGNPFSADSLLSRVKEIKEKAEKQAPANPPDVGMPVTPRLKRLLYLLKQLTFWKNERLDVLSLADARMEPLFQAAADSLTIPIDQLFNMTTDEIEQSLSKGELAVSRKVLADRSTAYCLALHDGKIDFYQPAGDKKSDHQGQKPDVLKGVGASGGIVRGKVRVLHTTAEAKTLKSGEIIVTTMTRPEMGAALDRAAAFVTDEGGLLCHAAIIAREMNKPCIIGTQTATKVLKDGDMIEVDGNMGIITCMDDQDEYHLGKPEDLFYWGPSRAKPLYMDDFMLAAEEVFVWMFNDPVMPNPPKTLVLFHDEKMVWMQSKRFENFSKKAFIEYQKQDRLDKDRKDWNIAVTYLDTYARTKLKDLSRTAQFSELAVSAWKPTIFAEFSLYGASAVITEQLKRFTEKERQIIWGAFTLPHQLLFMQQIDAELATGDPYELAKKYPWLQDGYQGVSDNIEEYFINRQNIVKENTVQPVEKTSHRKAVAKQFNLTKIEIDTLNLARQLAYFMDQRKAWMMRTRRYIVTMTEAVAAVNNTSLSKLEYTRLEYLDKKPKRFYGWLYSKGKLKDIPAGVEGELWERYVEFKASSTVLKGLVASSGGRHFINGEVRVVKRPTDAVADDRILVVTATSPSYVPLMRKARALITDHGGMMSHAAIVARELGLPCIIGTKHATKTLKSGDKIVLDLVKGEINL